MARPDIDNSDAILNGYRGIRTVAVGNDDIEFEFPVTVRVATTGNLTYVDALGGEHTLTGLAAGADVVGPGDGLVMVRIIRGSSSVTSVIVGQM